MASIEKRSDNSFRITVSLGYDSLGKKRFAKMTWKPETNLTEKQIQKKLNQLAFKFEEEVKSGKFVGKNIRFNQFSQTWIEQYAEHNLAVKTVERYKAMLVDINRYFDNVKLTEINTPQILAFYELLRKTPNRTDRKWKANSCFIQNLKALHWSKDKLSKAIPISHNALQSILSQKNVSERTALKAAQYFEKKIEDLFERSSEDSYLSETTILHYHQLLSSILQSAVEWGYLFDNPCKRMKRPKAKKPPWHYLNETQAVAFLAALQTEPEPYKSLIQILLFTGLRRSELMGLRWADIDFDEQTLSVRQSRQYSKEKRYIVTTTKSESSVRKISIGKTLVDILLKYKAWQEKEHIYNEPENERFHLLCERYDGSPMHPDTLSGWLRKFVQRKNLPDINIHGLRHTNATLQIAEGVDVRTVANRLGHSMTSTTLNIYSHALKSRDQMAAETLEKLLQQPTEK